MKLTQKNYLILLAISVILFVLSFVLVFSSISSALLLVWMFFAFIFVIATILVIVRKIQGKKAFES